MTSSSCRGLAWTVGLVRKQARHLRPRERRASTSCPLAQQVAVIAKTKKGPLPRPAWTAAQAVRDALRFAELQYTREVPGLGELMQSVADPLCKDHATCPSMIFHVVVSTVEKLRRSQVICIQGETGCGKPRTQQNLEKVGVAIG